MRYIFVQEEGQTFLTSCVAKQLQVTECQTSGDHLLNSIIQSHHIVHGSGAKTLLSLTKLWLEEMKGLQRQGISRRVITNGFQQAVNLCVGTLEPVTLSVDALHARLKKEKFTVEKNDVLHNSREGSNGSSNQSGINNLSHTLHYKEKRKEEKPKQTNVLQKPLKHEMPTSAKTIIRKDDICNDHYGMRNKDINVDAKFQEMLNTENPKEEFKEVVLSVDQQLDKFNNDNSCIEKLPQSLSTRCLSNPLQDLKIEEPVNETYIEPIELKMKNLKSDNECDEDIGWFFEDGKVPPQPELDQSMIGVLEEIGGPLMNDSLALSGIEAVNGVECGTKTLTSILEFRKESRLNHFQDRNDKNTSQRLRNFDTDLKHDYGMFSINQSNQPECSDDDEFADCFSNGKKSASSDLPCSYLRAHSEKTNTEFACIGNYSSLKTGKVSSGSDDEFDECFDDISTEVKNSENFVKQSSKVIESSDNGFNCSSVNTCGSFIGSDELNSGSEKPLLKKTEDNSCVGEFENRNRLGKSIKIAENEETSFKKVDCKVINENGDMMDKLQALLKQKENQAKSKVLNRSRHFGNISGTLEELRQNEIYQKKLESDTVTVKCKYKQSDILVFNNVEHKSSDTMPNQMNMNKVKQHESEDVKSGKCAKICESLCDSSKPEVPAMVSSKSSIVQYHKNRLSERNCDQINSFSSLCDRNDQCSDEKVDEFDDCFDNNVNARSCEYNAVDTNAKLRMGKQENSTRTQESKSGESDTLSVKHINDKLNAILLNKSRSNTVSSKVLNKSRHFKTVDSTVQELKNVDSFGGSKSLKNVKDNDLKNCNQTGEKEYVECLQNTIEHIVSGVSHGHEEFVDSLCGVIQCQNSASDDVPICDLKDIRLNLDRLHTLAVTGSMMSGLCQMFEGLVVKTTTEQMTLIQKEQDYGKRCLLINGDLSCGFRHKGYKQTQKVKIQRSQVPTETKENVWLEGVMNILYQLSIQMILVKGTVDSSLVQQCLVRNIIVIPGVTYKVLQAVGEATDAGIATYIEECTKENIAHGVCITALRSDWMDCTVRTGQFAVINPSKCPVQSVIFSHPIQSVAENNEEMFWHAAHRLSNVFKCGKVIQGAGRTEFYCHQMLKDEADRLERETLTKEEQTLAVIYSSVARGFLYFYLHLRKQLGLSNDSMQCCNCSKTISTVQNKPQHIITEVNEYDKVNTISAVNIDNVTDKTDKHFSGQNNTENVQTSEMEISSFRNNCHLHSYLTRCENDVAIYDDYISKTEAWISAVKFAVQTFRTDMEIITGQADSKFCVL